MCPPPCSGLRGAWGASAPGRELLSSSGRGRALGIPSLLLSEPGSLLRTPLRAFAGGPGFHGLCLLLPFPAGESELGFGGGGSCRMWVQGSVQTWPLWQKGTRLVLGRTSANLAFLRGFAPKLSHPCVSERCSQPSDPTIVGLTGSLLRGPLCVSS